MKLSPRILFPFLNWFPLKSGTLRADFIAGLTVALVLVPQSMAYAQLAGLPAYYGLYAAFLPVAVAALWGSSHQLGTGPVAVASLLTASSLAPLATPGTDPFVILAIMLALLVEAVWKRNCGIAGEDESLLQALFLSIHGRGPPTASLGRPWRRLALIGAGDCALGAQGLSWPPTGWPSSLLQRP